MKGGAAHYSPASSHPAGQDLEIREFFAKWEAEMARWDECSEDEKRALLASFREVLEAMPAWMIEPMRRVLEKRNERREEDGPDASAD
jgi:hypothetical protein